MLTAEEHAERMRLYHQGLNDVEIGERLYITKCGVYCWRKANGLPPNKPRVKWTPEQKKKALSIAKRKGISTARKETGVPEATIRMWRKHVG